ncbi:MAG: hypothetical protein NC200_01630 [Candidatus Gastranaerophilales bacterium]|nr:hypothetical protein [Candidatus Gastranaerophilales bacterium]
MAIDEKELQKYASTLSIERLLSLKHSDEDSIELLIERYKTNLCISQALYPELSTLEVTLRNAIDTMLMTCISPTWLEDEVKQQKILSNHEYEMLLTAYNDIKSTYPNNYTRGKVIANLTFGFWTNICSKWYCSNIWNKGCCFKGVFVNYPSKINNIGAMATKLRTIRRFRNRIFHYEPIFKHPQNTLKMYNEIMEMINYLPSDNSSILEDTSSFLDVYNKSLTTLK